MNRVYLLQFCVVVAAAGSQATLLSGLSGAFSAGMIRGVILFLAAGLSTVPLLAGEPAASVSVFDGDVLCIRAAYLTDSFAEQVHSLQPTNKVVGTVLDLRFADGDDKSVDAAVKLFAGKKTPLAIVVNSQTRGAAAELATRLRLARAGILIGSTNLPGTILTDIAVAASLEDERKYLANPFAAPNTNVLISLSAKNELLPFVDHMSEAQLVQRRIKDGEDEGDEPLSPRVMPAQPVIRDPALARAVDLLKALAILKPMHG